MTIAQRFTNNMPQVGEATRGERGHNRVLARGGKA
ncbi:hypothetical protein CTP10_R29280 [Cupriavidus sp. P-10]|nr:hypothetical protein CTP10_R29280 [Cupriavidus sp. P-10]